MNPPSADAPFEGPTRRPIRRDERATGRIEVAPRNAADGFPAAARHSRRVRFLRIALPAAVIVAVAAYVVVTRSGTPADVPEVNYDNIVFGGEATVIERPRLTGYQAGGEAYALEADRATQRNDDPDVLTLEGVRANFELPDGINAAFTAPAGDYDQRTGTMRLSGGLTMTLDNGIDATMETIVVDVANGTITTDRPFTLRADGVTIEGNTLDMTTERMTIGGGVHAVMTMGGPP
ncbi:MAG: LPS export ABC transporter periplasmic protein LptC [Bauldia sp.]|nr:LPS export ABC transporter periplasmic protein LptC [Bauldia sp.]